MNWIWIESYTSNSGQVIWIKASPSAVDLCRLKQQLSSKARASQVLSLICAYKKSQGMDSYYRDVGSEGKIIYHFVQGGWLKIVSIPMPCWSFASFLHKNALLLRHRVLRLSCSPEAGSRQVERRKPETNQKASLSSASILPANLGACQSISIVSYRTWLPGGLPLVPVYASVSETKKET